MRILTTVGCGIRKAASYVGFFLVGYSALCGFTMMLEITGDVVGRYIFRHPIPGTMHIVSYYFMVAFIFFPLSNVQFRKEHIVALFFTQKLPDIWKQILDLFAQLAMFGVVFIFGWYTWEKALMALAYKEYIEETYRVVVWPAHFYLPIGSWALCLQLVVDIYDSSVLLFGGKRKE